MTRKRKKKKRKKKKKASGKKRKPLEKKTATTSLAPVLFDIPPSECNRTISVPDRVRIPELTPSLRGSFILCTFSIRPELPDRTEEYERPVIRIEVGNSF